MTQPPEPLGPPDQPDYFSPTPAPSAPASPWTPGYPPQPGYPQQFVTVNALQAPTSGWATASLVLGLIGIFGGFCIFGIPCVVAVVAGHIALVHTKNGAKGGRGQAVAGLILGYIPLAFLLLYFAAQLIIVIAVTGNAPTPVPSVSATP